MPSPLHSFVTSMYHARGVTHKVVGCMFTAHPFLLAWWLHAEFKGSSKGSSFLQGSSLEEPDFGRFVRHSMPSRAEILFVQLSVSKHVIAFTVNVLIKLDHVARCEGIPQCLL